MALVSLIPRETTLNVIGGEFLANFGAPTPAKYDFTNYVVAGVRYNSMVPLGLKLRPNYLYFFHQMDFSLSIDESVFLRAIDPAVTPTMTIRDAPARRAIFNAPFRLFRYFENKAVDFFYQNLNSNATVEADFECVLTQPAELVGIGTVYAQVSFTVYEITNDKFIREGDFSKTLAKFQEIFGKDIPASLLRK